GEQQTRIWIAVLDIIHTCMYLISGAPGRASVICVPESALPVLRSDLPALTESVGRRRQILKNRVRPHAIPMSSLHCPGREPVARGRCRICANRSTRGYFI